MAIQRVGILVFFLRPGSQEIEVTSDPPGATVLVDNKEQDPPTPLRIKLQEGRYAIGARHEKLQLPEQSTNIVVQGGAGRRLHFQFEYGSVAIKSEPPGATILSPAPHAAPWLPIGITTADPAGFVIPAVPAGEVTYYLALEHHRYKTVRGVVTNHQRLVLSETLPSVGILDTPGTIGIVELDSTPRGARVFWKEKLLTSSTPDRTELEPGTYDLRATYKDWPEKRITIDVKSGTNSPANYYFENGGISLESDPSGATVWIGTNNLGTTPLSVRRPVGETAFRFDLTGFETTNVMVKVADRSRMSVRPVLVSDSGVFELSADPAEAIILDSKAAELGRTSSGRPLKTSRAPGSYFFTARTEGLSDVGISLTIGKRELKKHTFFFDYGSVAITSDPTGAAVSVDGKTLGLTPVNLVQKPGAKIRYCISLPHYIPTTNEVSVQSHERNVPVLVRLLPE